MSNETSTCVHTTGAFVLQHHTSACTSDTMLATIEECASAKALLDPGIDAVERDDFDRTPKGCSRTKGKWYFNGRATGSIDDATNEHGTQQRRMLSDCNCDEYQLSKVSQSWYNRKWTKATDKNCGGKPVYKASSSRFLIYDQGQTRWEFTDGSCRMWRNWSVGAEGAECPSDNAAGWKATCIKPCLLYTSPSPRDYAATRMPSSA